MKLTLKVTYSLTQSFKEKWQQNCIQKFFRQNAKFVIKAFKVSLWDSISSFDFFYDRAWATWIAKLRLLDSRVLLQQSSNYWFLLKYWSGQNCLTVHIQSLQGLISSETTLISFRWSTSLSKHTQSLNIVAYLLWSIQFRIFTSDTSLKSIRTYNEYPSIRGYNLRSFVVIFAV